ncbi:MAG TPA: NAD(P)H-binding protein [Candidatus Thermoplasmatota archaeon]|nr:NAD(P)H-binding protein [Candidatus Thermoplasmatota archaeon]
MSDLARALRAEAPGKPARPVVLLTGATGYVGGQLLPALEAVADVRCLARRPDAMRGRAGAGTEVVAGDLLDPATLPRALDGVDVAYYLVHSMGERGSFVEKDREAARNFAAAARDAGVRRIVYLGGLGPDDASLSPHLASRHETGGILRSSGVPVVEFRASIVLGAGSKSFEMMRALVERLPILVTPRWVATPAQPIAVHDVVRYLAGALALELDESVVFEIGGRDRTSYGGLMRAYARRRGLARLMVPVPVLTPGLSSLWLGLVTPFYARAGRALIESVRHATIARDDAPRRLFDVDPMGLDASLDRALADEDADFETRRWSARLGPDAAFEGRENSRLVESRAARVAAPPERALAAARARFEGEPLARFALASAAAGLVRLAATRRLPGRLRLQLEATPADAGSALRATLEFDAKGLLGIAFWHLLAPARRRAFVAALDDAARGASA